MCARRDATRGVPIPKRVLRHLLQSYLHPHSPVFKPGRRTSGTATVVLLERKGRLHGRSDTRGTGRLEGHSTGCKAFRKAGCTDDYAGDSGHEGRSLDGKLHPLLVPSVTASLCVM
jgi:hypothetical protein